MTKMNRMIVADDMNDYGFYGTLSGARRQGARPGGR